MLYPCVTLAPPPPPDEKVISLLKDKVVFLSINRSHHLQVLASLRLITFATRRYERKKNIGLAIKAFALLPKHLLDKSRLVIAGGYDTNVRGAPLVAK